VITFHTNIILGYYSFAGYRIRTFSSDARLRNLEEYVQTHPGSFTLYFVWANSPAIFHEN